MPRAIEPLESRKPQHTPSPSPSRADIAHHCKLKSQTNSVDSPSSERYLPFQRQTITTAENNMARSVKLEKMGKKKKCPSLTVVALCCVERARQRESESSVGPVGLAETSTCHDSRSRSPNRGRSSFPIPEPSCGDVACVLNNFTRCASQPSRRHAKQSRREILD